MTERPKRAGPPGIRPPPGKRTDSFDPGCTRCPRLAEFLAETHERYPDYWARPVPSFGPDDARVLFVGLALLGLMMKRPAAVAGAEGH